MSTDTRYIRDITVSANDDVAGLISEYLTHDWDFTNVKVLWHSEPEWTGETYMVFDAEISYDSGWNLDFAEQHSGGPK